MRYLPLLSILLLTGCASATKDFGSALGDAFGGISSGLGAGATLEYSLYQDYRRKSEQLEFLSLNTYSCGEPGTESERTIRSQTNVGINRAREELIKTFDKLDLLIAYGKSIADYRTSVSTFASTADGIKSATGAVTKFSGAEAQAVGAIIVAFTELAKVVYTESEAGALRELARAAKPEIAKWITTLKKNFTKVNQRQLLAYHYWNGCALERLRFIRDTYPTGPSRLDKRGHVQLEGMIKSTVLDFAAAYSDYITEREKFLSAMPNYNDLLDAINTANDKLLEVQPADIGSTLASIGAIASALQGARDSISKPGS